MDGIELNKNSRISLLIPVYGVELFIERCVRSLFEQTYSNIEYVFVDDCTKDRSIEILNQLIDRYSYRKKDVKIIRHQINCGLSAARNTALENSTGKYIMHVDSDDYLELNAIESLHEYAIKNNSDIVIGGYKIVGIKKSITISQKIPDDNYEYVKRLLRKECSPSIWGKLFLREFYISSGIRSIEGLNQGEDYVVMPRLIYCARHIGVIDVPLYNYIQYNVHSYTNNITEKSISDMVKADEILERFFISQPDAEKFTETLVIAKLRTETYLLKMASVSYYSRIFELYSELNNKYQNMLRFQDRILLKLGHKGCYKLLRMFVVVGFWVKKNIFRSI